MGAETSTHPHIFAPTAPAAGPHLFSDNASLSNEIYFTDVNLGTLQSLVNGQGLSKVDNTISASAVPGTTISLLLNDPVAVYCGSYLEQQVGSAIQTVAGLEFANGTITIASVPEPGSLLLSLVTLAVVATFAVRRRARTIASR